MLHTMIVILLVVMAFSAVYMGARLVFNLNGNVDRKLARRRAVLELKGQRSGDLAFADTQSFGPIFYRIVGGVIGLTGLFLLALLAIGATRPFR
ncbi:hypothetical protein [Streptomyces phaeoluteigriseus]